MKQLLLAVCLVGVLILISSESNPSGDIANVTTVKYVSSSVIEIRDSIFDNTQEGDSIGQEEIIIPQVKPSFPSPLPEPRPDPYSDPFPDPMLMILPPPPEKIPPPLDEKIVYESYECDKEAAFPGGWKALMEYMDSTLIFPSDAREMEIHGKVYLKFVVADNGEIEQVQILRGISKSCDAEAKRVILRSPLWEPAERKGIKVNSYMTIPIRFMIK